MDKVVCVVTNVQFSRWASPDGLLHMLEIFNLNFIPIPNSEIGRYILEFFPSSGSILLQYVEEANSVSASLKLYDTALIAVICVLC